MSSCSKCNEDVIKEDQICCSSCSAVLHFGCAAMVESNFRKMTKDRKKAWKCINCKGAVEKKDSPACDEEAERENRLVKKMKVFIDDLSKDIKSKLIDFEKSLQHNSDQMQDVLDGFNEMKKNFSLLQSKQNQLETENIILKKTVKELKLQFQNMEQRSLELNLEVSGLPDAVDTRVIVPTLCAKANIQLPDPNAYTVKRATTGVPGRPKSVVLSFKCKELRDSILKKSKQCRPITSDFTKNTSDAGSIYVNDHLSPYLKQLLYNAKKIQKEKGYAYLWVTEGKILLKKATSSKTIRVYDIDDMK